MKQTEGTEKAIAAAVMAIINLASIVGLTDIDPQSMEAAALAIGTLAAPALVWLTANSKG